MTSRKYLPTLAELIDRLSIVQLKEVFISEHRGEYTQEIKDIMHDIDVCLNMTKATSSDVTVTPSDSQPTIIDSETIRDIVVLAQMNLHIWNNEKNCRLGKQDGSNLELTHSLNGIRNIAKNRIQSKIGGRKDYKVDCLAADAEKWKPSGW
jgi:hypothetical protein